MTKRWGVYMAAGIVAAVAGALVLAVGWYASGRVIHPPQYASRYGPKDYDLPLENVQFQSRDGVQLVGWFIRGESSATVVLAQGRGSYKDHFLPHADYLHRAGFSVLLFDFRYRGDSEGDAQTLGAKESWDLQSAVDYVMTRSDVDPERIGVQGESMGAATAILAAADRPDIKGIVAHIPFTSVNDLLCHSFKHEFGIPCFPFAWVTKWLAEVRTGVDFDRVAPIDVISGLSPRPVLLIDEGLDALFPARSVERLYRAAKHPKEFLSIPDASHGEAWEKDPEQFERRVLAFWRETFGITPSDQPRDHEAHPALSSRSFLPQGRS